MKIQIVTKVNGNYQDLILQFDRKLFEALKPPIGKLEILKFTGSKKGDRVHLRFLSPVKTEWISDITQDEINEKEAFFVDEGVKLPFPLRYWKHKHIVQKITADSSFIIDEITFKGSNFLFTFLLYPALYIAFWLRKKTYRSYFN